MKAKFRITLLMIALILLGACSPKTTTVEEANGTQAEETVTGKGSKPSKKKKAPETNKNEKNVGVETTEHVEPMKMTVVSVGDAMYHIDQVHDAYVKSEETYDFSNYYTEIKSLVEGADIGIANYETTMNPNREVSDYPNFNSPYETLTALKEAGFDVLGTANNHCLDTHVEGLEETNKGIVKAGMEPVGSRLNKTDKPYLIKEANGIKVGILAYTYGFNGMDYSLDEDTSFMVSPLDEERVQPELEELESQVDITIVLSHWGVEYQSNASSEQRELAKKMVNWGADIILGSHPHVIQEAETLTKDGQDKFIIYSQGNFTSLQRARFMGTRLTETGMLVRLVVEKDPASQMTTIQQVTMHPNWVDWYEDDNGNRTLRVRLSEDYLPGGPRENDVSSETLERIRQSHRDALNAVTGMGDEGE